MRIVAGRLGGRRFQAPPGTDTRPTSDRVREALFSALGALDGEVVLDLFAGSGGLSLEALSRGADRAVLVERDARAAAVIQGNLDALQIGPGEARVRRRDAFKALRDAREAGETYDLVFLDPPYRLAAGLGPQLAQALLPVLAPGARVVGESDRRTPLDLPGLRTTFERRYGDTLLRIHTALTDEKRIAVCPGSYDPITNGHLDIIGRTAAQFDEVVVAVVNVSVRKNQPIFSIEERLAFIEEATADLPNVRAEPFSVLVVDYARAIGARTIVKGLRAISDFEYELEMGQLNRMQAPEVDTLYLMASPQYSFLSSSGVKELATFGGDISSLVPESVARRLKEELTR
jgi:pantetheine-phosphate adenylyltransferase/16S rRNA (guanine(966)-N(2))-methyltransferase RsmD